MHISVAHAAEGANQPRVWLPPSVAPCICGDPYDVRETAGDWLAVDCPRCRAGMRIRSGALDDIARRRGPSWLAAPV